MSQAPKKGRDYLDDVDFWADKTLNARLACQKADAEYSACETNRSKAFAALTEYVRSLETQQGVKS